MPLQKIEWPPTLFSWVPYPLIKEKFICMQVRFAFAYVHSVKQHYKQGRALKVSFPATVEIWKIHLWQYMPLWWMNHSEKVNEPLLFGFQWYLTFYKMFEAKDGMTNTSAITAVTKSSMKPWRKKEENTKKQ